MTSLKAVNLRVLLVANGNRARFLIIVLFLWFPGSLPAQNLTAKINRYMTAQVTINHFSGSILVAQNGRVLVKTCYGPTDRRYTSDKCSAGERYPVGSIAKQFTALAILQYREQGKIKLQDSVCAYISTCPDAWQGITILDLLTQTDGLPEADSSLSQTDLPQQQFSASGDLNLLRERPLEFTPGARVKFGNSGYAVLSAIMERLAGQSYLNYLHDHVFVPAGMRNTGADTGRVWNKPLQWVTPSDVVAASPYLFAGLDSTVDDLYRWDRSLDTERLISKRSVEEMLTPQRDGYGFGWAILKEFGQQVETQNGGLNLLSSSIRRYPENDACVIVLSDATNVDAEKISHDLGAILFDKHYEIPATLPRVAINPATYKAYVGFYEMPLGLSLIVKTKHDRLTVQGAREGREIELVPKSETQFRIPGSDTGIAFVRGTNGQADELVLQQGNREIPFRRSTPKL